MKLDRIALGLIIVPIVGWLAVVVGPLMFGDFPDVFPVLVLVTFLTLIGLAGWILYRVVVERIRNKEDDYYEETVDR